MLKSIHYGCSDALYGCSPSNQHYLYKGSDSSDKEEQKQKQSKKVVEQKQKQPKQVVVKKEKVVAVKKAKRVNFLIPPTKNEA